MNQENGKNKIPIAAKLNYALIMSGLTLIGSIGSNLPYSGNVIDEYYDRNGERNQGSLMGIGAILGAPTGSIVIFIFSSIISAFGYVSAPGQQPPVVQIGLRLGIGGVAIIYSVIALILVILMPKLRSQKPSSNELENPGLDKVENPSGPIH